jgi:hypothetical protein
MKIKMYNQFDKKRRLNENRKNEERREGVINY